MNDTSTIDGQLLDIMLRAGTQWVLWLLLALSLVAVAIIAERIWFFIQERRPRPLLEQMRARLLAEGPKAALAAIEGARSMEAAVARACLLHAADGAGAIEEHVAATVDTQRLRYERGLAFLGTLGNNAPFVGLFGTVLGIVRAFHDLAADSELGSRAVMAGIAEALVATGVGLLVALPAVAAYNAFMRHVEASEVAAGALGHELLGRIKAGDNDRATEEQG